MNLKNKKILNLSINKPAILAALLILILFIFNLAGCSIAGDSSSDVSGEKTGIEETEENRETVSESGGSTENNDSSSNNNENGSISDSGEDLISSSEDPLKISFKYDNFNIDYFIDLSEEDKEYLIEVAHAAINDSLSKKGIEEADETIFLSKYEGINNEIFIILRYKGSKLATSFGGSTNLSRSVYLVSREAVEKINKTENNIKVNDSINVEIIITGSGKIMDEGFEVGVHSLKIEKDGKVAAIPNALAIEANIGKIPLLEKLCLEVGADKNYYLDKDAGIYYYPVIHFGETYFDEKIASFYRGSVTDLVPDVNRDKLAYSLDLACGWMLLNLDEDGYFNYGYSPSSGKYLDQNNMIRQFLSSRWLASQSNEADELKQMHKVNLDYILRNWYVEDGDLGYIYFGEKSKLGAMGMALSTIARSPFLDNYIEYAIKLANTIVSLQNDDGSFNSWYIEPDYNYDEDSLLRFYSGEGMLGLIEFFEATGKQKYLEAAIRSQDYYIEKYVNRMEENYSPAYVPWQTMCLSKLYYITGEEKYIEPIFKLNDEVIKIQNQKGEPYPDFLGRFYDPLHPEYGPPNSGSTSPYVESLAYAYQVAKEVGDRERMEKYRYAIALGVHNLMNLQFQGLDMYYLGHPERVEGALRYRMFDNRIRIDTTQHTIDAFEKVMEVIYGE